MAKNCVCERHLDRDEILKNEKKKNLYEKKELLSWLPGFIKQLEEEINSPEFNKPKYCVGHGDDCPCTLAKEGGDE